jgi:hypothetical protein
VQDNDTGYFALTLMQLPSYRIPFSQCLFLSAVHTLPMNQYLAAINGKLIGLSILTEDQTDALDVLRSQMQTISLSTKLRTSSTKEFDLQYLTDRTCFPCHAVGIIRAIDLEKEEIIVTLPPNLPIPLNTSYGIITPSSNLPIPTFFLPGSRTLTSSTMVWSSYPYFTNEMKGEGSKQIKPRGNLKRRKRNSSSDRTKHHIKNREHHREKRKQDGNQHHHDVEHLRKQTRNT